MAMPAMGGFSLDDELILRDEKMFFHIVQTTGDDMEARDMLERARHRVLFDKGALNNGGNHSEDQPIARLLTRLNHEIKMVNMRINSQDWHAAVKEICGQELYSAVKVRLADMREAVKH